MSASSDKPRRSLVRRLVSVLCAVALSAMPVAEAFAKKGGNSNKIPTATIAAAAAIPAARNPIRAPTRRPASSRARKAKAARRPRQARIRDAPKRRKSTRRPSRSPRSRRRTGPRSTPIPICSRHPVRRSRLSHGPAFRRRRSASGRTSSARRRPYSCRRGFRTIRHAPVCRHGSASCRRTGFLRHCRHRVISAACAIVKS